MQKEEGRIKQLGDLYIPPSNFFSFMRTTFGFELKVLNIIFRAI